MIISLQREMSSRDTDSLFFKKSQKDTVMSTKSKTKIRRSRTGCKSCKIRRVKCDESKPICLACKHMDLECYYEFSTREAYTTRGLKPTSHFHEDEPSSWSATQAISNHTKSSLVVFSNGSPEPNLQNLSSHPLLAESNMSQIRLYHHFVHSIITEMSALHVGPLSDGLRSPSAITWSAEIPQLGFTNEYVIHAILAISAKDLEFKTSHYDLERSQLLRSAIYHENIAIEGLRQALASAPSSPQVFFTVLVLMWLSSLKDDTTSVMMHVAGANRLLDSLPESLFHTNLGQELLILFVKLDLTTANFNQSTSKSNFGTTHLVRPMKFLKMRDDSGKAAGLWCLITEKLSIFKSDDSFLMHRATSLTQNQKDALLSLLPRLCNWYTSTSNLPEYSSILLGEDSWTAKHPFGSLVYATPAAAISMAQFCVCLQSIYRNLYRKASFCPGTLQTWIAIRVRQIYAGAMDNLQTSYGTTIFRQSLAVGICMALEQTRDIIHDPSVRQWEVELMNRLLTQLSRTVWDIVNPSFIFFMRERLHILDFQCPYQNFSSTITINRLREDFNSFDEGYQAYLCEVGCTFNTYTLYILEDQRLRVIVDQTTTLEDGSLESKTDEEQTAHWCKLADRINFCGRWANDAEPGTIEETLVRLGCAELLLLK